MSHQLEIKRLHRISVAMLFIAVVTGSTAAILTTNRASENLCRANWETAGEIRVLSTSKERKN